MRMRDENIALEEGGDGLVFVAADAYSERVFQTCSLQAFNFRAHCRGEKVGASLPGEDFEDFVENWSEV